jgi:hypothetical protein
MSRPQSAAQRVSTRICFRTGYRPAVRKAFRKALRRALGEETSPSSSGQAVCVATRRRLWLQGLMIPHAAVKDFQYIDSPRPGQDQYGSLTTAPFPYHATSVPGDRPRKVTKSVTRSANSGISLAFASKAHLFYNSTMETSHRPRTIAKVYRIVGLREQPSDFTFWQNQPPAARLAALEEIRREYHGWNNDTQPRLQRVCKIVKR